MYCIEKDQEMLGMTKDHELLEVMLIFNIITSTSC